MSSWIDCVVVQAFHQLKCVNQAGRPYSCIHYLWIFDFHHPIIDKDAPELNCPDVLSDTDSGLSTSSTVTFHPAVTDNVDQYPTVLCSHSSHDIFDLGHTLVSCNATDDSGNIDFCSFNVTVRGMLIEFIQTTRVIFAPLKTVSVFHAENCVSQSIEYICILWWYSFNITRFTSKLSSIKWKVFVSFLSDNEPPVCPYDMTVDTDEGSDSAIVDLSEGLEDNVDPYPSISCSPEPAYLVGRTLLNCQVSDYSGNVQSCQFNLTVRGKFRISIEFHLQERLVFLSGYWKFCYAMRNSSTFVVFNIALILFKQYTLRSTIISTLIRTNLEFTF